MGKGDPQATEVRAPEENGISRKGLAATGILYFPESVKLGRSLTGQFEEKFLQHCLKFQVT